MALYQYIKFHLFQRNARDKLFIAKMNKGSNSVNTVDRVMIFALYNFPHGPLSVY